MFLLTRDVALIAMYDVFVRVIVCFHFLSANELAAIAMKYIDTNQSKRDYTRDKE